MPDFEIQIKTKADLADAKRLEAELQKQIATLKAAGQSATEFEQRLKKVQASLKDTPAQSGFLGKLQGELGNLVRAIPGVDALSGVFTKIASGPAALAAGAIAVITSGLVAAKKAIGEFAESQEKIAGLDQALAIQRNLTEANRQKLQDLAGQLQETTAIADDKWLPVLETLLKFGSNPATIGMDVEAVKNLAGLLGGDLNSAAMLVSKAIQGNYDAFGRYGIVVKEAGTQTQKLNRLYEQLAERGAGILEAKSKTLIGQFGSLKNAASDLWEAVGNLINRTGVLQAALLLLAQAVNAVASIFPRYQEKLDSITNRVPPLKKGLEQTKDSVVATGEAMDAASESAGTFSAQGLQKVKDSAKAATDELEKTVQAARKLQSEADQLDEAQTDLVLAKIDENEALGRITPLEARKTKAGVRMGLAKRKAVREKATLDAERKRIDELESGAKTEAESKLGRSADTAEARDAALVKARVTAGKSDQEILADQTRQQLAATNRRSGKPTVVGEQRRLLEENLTNLQDRIAAGQLTFTAAETEKRAELQSAQEELDRVRTGPGSGRGPAEYRTQRVTAAQQRLTAAREGLDAITAFSTTDKRLQEQRQAASEASGRLLDIRTAVTPRRREVELKSTLVDMRTQGAEVGYRTENIKIQSEATRTGERVRSIPSAAASPAAGFSTQQIEAEIRAVAQANIRSLQTLGAATITALNNIGGETDRIARELEETSRRHASLISHGRTR